MFVKKANYTSNNTIGNSKDAIDQEPYMNKMWDFNVYSRYLDLLFGLK